MLSWQYSLNYHIHSHPTSVDTTILPKKPQKTQKQQKKQKKQKTLVHEHTFWLGDYLYQIGKWILCTIFSYRLSIFQDIIWVILFSDFKIGKKYVHFLRRYAKRNNVRASDIGKRKLDCKKCISNTKDKNSVHKHGKVFPFLKNINNQSEELLPLD